MHNSNHKSIGKTPKNQFAQLTNQFAQLTNQFTQLENQLPQFLLYLLWTLLQKEVEKNSALLIIATNRNDFEKGGELSLTHKLGCLL